MLPILDEAAIPASFVMDYQYSEEAERHVVGEVLTNPCALPLLIGTLKPEYFFTLNYRLIYHAATVCFEAGTPVDVVSVTETLKYLGHYETAGKSELVNTLAIEHFMPQGTLEYWGEVIRGHAFKRELRKHAVAIVNQSDGQTAEEAMSEAQEGLLAIQAHFLQGKQVSFQDTVDLALEQITQKHLGAAVTTGLKTGYPQLDAMIDGIRPQSLTIIGASTGVGKTAFMLNLALQFAKQGHSVLFFSLEMRSQDLLERMIRALSKSQTMDGFQEAARLLKTLPIEIVERQARLDEITARAIQYKLMHQRTPILFVDYLQLIPSTGETRNIEVSKVSWGLKRLADTLQTQVIAASQLSRSHLERGNTKPGLHDLRDSGSIEQDAALVMLLSRDKDASSVVYVDVAKNRFGPKGTVEFAFRDALQLFIESGGKRNVF